MTAPTTPNILGPSYLDADYFIDNARIFKCRKAIVDWSSDEIEALLASASRVVDSYCARDIGSFDGDQIFETHAWNNNRRIKVNNPPVSEVISYVIRSGPNGDGSSGFTSSFQPGDLLINRQENYIELAAMVVATALTPQVIALGITTPQVEITYTSYESVPNNIQMATGYIAGAFANESVANDLLPSGIGSMKVADMAISRAGWGNTSGFNIPEIARRLLQPNTRIAIA